MPRGWLRCPGARLPRAPLGRRRPLHHFTTAAAEEQFPDALAAVVATYESDGLDVVVTVGNAAFARLQVTDPATGNTAKVELAVDWRAHPPVVLSAGPVLHPDDAVGNKVCALFVRAQARDQIDGDAVLRSRRYRGDELLDRDQGGHVGAQRVGHSTIIRKDFRAVADAVRELITARGREVG